jgi:putative ABC transport system permease protein
MKYLHLIWSNLKRKKVRTTLTFLSILIAFVLFGYMVAIKTAFDMGVSVVGADRLVVRHKVSIIQLLPESYEARIEEIGGVAEATHATWFGGVYQRPSNFFAQMPVKPEEYMAMYPEFVLPEEQMDAWLNTRTGAIAGRATAERFGWKVGDRIPIQATIWLRQGGEQTWEFDLVGIYDGAEQATDTTQFLFRYDYFDEARQMGRGQIGWYLVRVDDPDLAVQAANAIDAEFANSPAETSAETEMAFVQGFAKQVGNIGAIMVGVLSAVFFTILLVAGNTMAQAVRERLNEIGVLKAIGFTDSQVLGMVLVESCLLAVLAGGTGLVVVWYLISLGDPTGGALPIFFLPPGAFTIGVAMAVGLGLVAGIFPALQASRLRIADALRRD